MTLSDTPIPFRDHVGIEVLHAGSGEAHAVMPWRQEIENGLAVAHGGAVATLVDIAMAFAAASAAPEPSFALTVDMQVQFMRPGTGDLHAWAEVTRQGRLSFVEARVLDRHQETVAKATGLFRLRPVDEALARKEEMAARDGT